MMELAISVETLFPTVTPAKLPSKHANNVMMGIMYRQQPTFVAYVHRLMATAISATMQGNARDAIQVST